MKYTKFADGSTRRSRLLAALTHPQWLHREDALTAVWPTAEERPKNYRQSLRNLIGELKSERRIEILDVGMERFVRLAKPTATPAPNLTSLPSDLVEDDDDDLGIEFEDD